MTFNQVFRFILCFAGLSLIILDIIFFDKNYIVAIIGGLIIFISGVQVHFLFYQKDRDPEEIVTKIKETVKSFKSK